MISETQTHSSALPALRLRDYAEYTFNTDDAGKERIENGRIFCASVSLFNEEAAWRDWSKPEVEKRISEDALRSKMAEPSKNFTASVRGDSRAWQHPGFTEFREESCEEVEKLLGVSRVELRLLCFYGRNYFMGWHNNANAPGERVYFSLAEEPNKSGLRYWDGEKIVTSYDQAGVTMRRFTIPEPSEGYFWHSVFSYTNRASMGFRILEE
jgi:hypothetical protein